MNEIFEINTWRKLLQINKFLQLLFALGTTPLKKFSETVVMRLPNSKFYFRPLFIEEIYMALGLWEPYVCRIFTPNSGDVVLDVGAHIGYYTVKVAQTVGSHGIVIAVEPDPRNLKILQKNIVSHQLKNVRLVNDALSHSSGYRTFKNCANPLFSRLTNKASKQATATSMMVKVNTIDNLCEEMGISRIDWVKIDVEDSASDVLKGGSKTLKEPTNIVVEVPDNQTLEVLTKLMYSFKPLLTSDDNLGYYYAIKKT